MQKSMTLPVDAIADNTDLLSALNAIDVNTLTRDEWLHVGMALHDAGQSMSVWDDWSSEDTRSQRNGKPMYSRKAVECAWNSFHKDGAGAITKATIFKMAQDRGWTPFANKGGVLDWDDWIEQDEPPEDHPYEPVKRKGSEDLAMYLSALFEPDDIVGYVTESWHNDDADKWLPKKGVYTRTAKELLDAIRKWPDDLGYVVGDWNKEAGAWIRFNPLDGNGVSDSNVTAFRYALVESDDMPVDEQVAAYKRLELPIVAMVSSAGKSVHAIVRIDAKDAQEYHKRVDYLYDFLDKNGVKVDRQNRNPARLSRMPGVDRNGKMQRLIATSLGRKSWNDWVDFTEGANDTLPPFVTRAERVLHPLPLKGELIKGVLRKGHKMLISGSSKAGKSFLLMQLAVCITEGLPWLNFPCEQGRVLYVNLEIDEASFDERLTQIHRAMGVKPQHDIDFVMWPLRGNARPLDKLVPIMLRRMEGTHYDAVIIDPIYKVITGDENNASEMGAFCNQFDVICEATGASVIYCHHHSKGNQGAKKAMDRASGSGVFARDPDAQLDLIQLELSDDLINNVRDGNATAWRMESSLREFPNFQPVDIWFEYPIHRVDTTGELRKLYPEGSPLNNLNKSPNRTQKADRQNALSNAFDSLNINSTNPVTVKDIAAYLEASEKSVRRYVKESNDFVIDKGVVFHKAG